MNNYCDIPDWSCANGDSIIGCYVCDGANVNGNADYDADCSDGSDELIDYCCKTEN